MSRKRKTRKTSGNIPAKTTPKKPTKIPTQNAQVQVSQFRGPIPPAQELENYNRIVPGAADRIIKMAEREQIHVRDMDNRIINYTFKERRLGQILGVIATLMAMSTSCVALYFGLQTAASIIGGATVVGLVTVFVTGRSSSDDKE